MPGQSGPYRGWFGDVFRLVRRRRRHHLARGRCAYGATIGGQYDNVRWLASDDKPGAVPEKRAGLTFSSTVALRYAYGKGKLAGQSLQAPDFTAVPQAVAISAHEITLHLGSGVYF